MDRSVRTQNPPRCHAARARMLHDDGRLEEAMERFLDGDRAAFTVIYCGLAPRIQRMLAQLGRERALAEDLTQETFARMVRARSTYQRGSEVAPWAFAIARHLYFDHVRRARHQRERGPEALSYHCVLAKEAPQPDEVLAASRMADTVEAVLDALPERQVEAFLLVREEGCSLGEAAERLGRSEMSVRLCAHRARAAIRQRLAEAWGVAA